MTTKNLLSIPMIFACFSLAAVGDVIKPTGATSTSTVGDPRVIDRAIDGSGLVDVSDPSSVLDDQHVYGSGYYVWLSSSTAVAGGVEELTFDLGGTYDINKVYHWTYTRDGNRNLKTFDISYSTDFGATFSSPVSAASLGMADWSIGLNDRSPSLVETRAFSTLSGVTDVRFSNLQNHGGTYFALSEIRFDGVPAGPVAGPVDPNESTVSASPAAVLADGTSTSTITVTLKDASGIPVGSEGVTLTSASGTPDISPVGTQTTNPAGVATFTVSSSTPGTEVFTATSVTDSVIVSTTASVDFQALVVDAASSTVSASPTAVPANDITTSTITVTVRNSGSLPLPGKLVSLSGDGSATIDPAGAGTDTSDASGVATFTVRSGTVGLETFTATSETVTIGTASVDFQTAPPADAGTSTVVASPASVPADGSTASTITVTLKDGSGTPVVSKEVSLAGDGSASITTDNNITNASGVATFAVRSSTAGTEVFTATCVTDSVVVTQTASVTFTQVGAQFLVTLLDAPVAASTSATEGTLANLYENSMSLQYVGTNTNGGGSFRGTPKDSDSYTGDSVKSQTVIYDMGEIVTFDGFIHAQALETDASSVGSIDFWVTNTDPGADFTAIANTWFGTTPHASKTLNTGDRLLHEYVLDGASLTGRYVIMRWICYEQATDVGSPGGYTFFLGQTATVTDYDTWSGSYPGLGLPGADDDGDGLTNDEERIFGLNPQNGGSANPYATPFDAAAGTFSYTRRTQSPTGLTYKIWYSTDLEQWFWESGAVQTPQSPVSGIEIVDVTIDPALLTEPKLFIQVSAEDLGPPPALSSLWGSNTTITMNFSEEMDPGFATDPANYTVAQDGGGSIAVTGAVLSGDGKTVTLTLGSALGIDGSFTVTTNRLANAVGQPLGNGTVGQFQTWDNDPNGIKVFILAGQSNMVGYGRSEAGNGGPGGPGSLRYLAIHDDDPKYSEYDYTSLLETPGDPATSNWKARDNVRVWWHNGGSGDLGGPIGSGNLVPTFGKDAGMFGPEYAFGQVLGDHYASDDVLIIKAAWGGRYLYTNFRPPSAVAKRGGVVGEFYEAIFDDAREVLLNLGSPGFFPEWSGRGYQIVGFAWHQGFSDKSPVERANEYKYNLPDFISDVRAEFGKPELPFVIASTGMNDAGPVDDPPHYPSYHDVEKAQLWAFPEIPKPASVLSDDTRPYWELAADSPFDQGYHWNHNARSYFRVGLGLGNNMVTLLGD